MTAVIFNAWDEKHFLADLDGCYALACDGKIRATCPAAKPKPGACASPGVHSAAIPRSVQRFARKSGCRQHRLLLRVGFQVLAISRRRYPYAMLPTQSPFDFMYCIAAFVRSPIVNLSIRSPRP